MIHRDRKLLDLAHRVNECQFQIEGVCAHYSDHGCEPAHSNELAHGKGTGLKSHDFRHVASCHNCHVEYDTGHMPKVLKRELFRDGWERTIALYFENGWIKTV